MSSFFKGSCQSFINYFLIIYLFGQLAHLRRRVRACVCARRARAQEAEGGGGGAGGGGGGGEGAGGEGRMRRGGWNRASASSDRLLCHGARARA